MSFDTIAGRLKSGEMLLCDGAWGTQMQKLGLALGDCPEEWNKIHPDRIRSIAREYFDAGADFCLTNTFGGNRYRLMRHGFADEVASFNKLGVSLCKEVADAAGRSFAASVGPTGEFVQPEGMLTRPEMLEAFREQMAAQKAGGAEAVCIETMYVLDETLLAIDAALELGLFCMACMTFDSTPQGFKTMMGSSVEESARALDKSGAHVIGSNCGNGIAEMVAIAKLMRPLTKKPLMIKANAGIPQVSGGQIVYQETPQLMAARIKDLKAAGVSIVGGCCGTTPEHIREFRKEVSGF